MGKLLRKPIMQYIHDRDRTHFRAYEVSGGDKRKLIATIEINLLDARRDFIESRWAMTGGCTVTLAKGIGPEYMPKVLKDLNLLKRQRLDYVLYRLDRLALEAMMAVTGQTTEKGIPCYSVKLDDVRPKDLSEYGYAIKSRCTKLGNALVKESQVDSRKQRDKELKVSYSIVKDGDISGYAKNFW